MLICKSGEYTRWDFIKYPIQYTFFMSIKRYKSPGSYKVNLKFIRSTHGVKW
jgi:hypothetical protein